MEKLLNEMKQAILDICVEGNAEIERIGNEYCEKILLLIPQMIPIESAEYSNEASYINGWNDCLKKISNN